MSDLVVKLTRLAKQIAAEKKPLHLMALIHRRNAAADKWDLLVSAGKLRPWSLDATVYIDELLKKNLTPQEKLRIAVIVPLPRDNKIVEWISEKGDVPPGDLDGLHPQDHFDRMQIIWRKKKTPQAA